MKKTYKVAFGLMISLLWLAGTACQQGAAIPKASDMASQSDSVAYAIGMNIGQSLNTPETKDLDHMMIFRGIVDVMEENEQAISQEELPGLFTRFQSEIDAKVGAANLEEGKSFLEENGQQEGVITTASGLQYKVLQEGAGESPVATSQVTVNYEGKLLDGNIFDSSYQRGQPATFRLNGVIPGWTEGVQLMKPGAKYQFYVPSELAYGLRGSPPNIGPHATLIFDVELLEVIAEEEGRK